MAVLGRTLRALSEIGYRPAIATDLYTTLGGANKALAVTIRAEIPAFSESANPELLPQLDEHSADHLRDLARYIVERDR